MRLHFGEQPAFSMNMRDEIQYRAGYITSWGRTWERNMRSWKLVVLKLVLSTVTVVLLLLPHNQVKKRFSYLDIVRVQCKKNPIYVFLFWELHGLGPNFHIHVSMSGPHIFLQKERQIDRGNIYIAHRLMNVDIGTVVAPFLFWEYLFRIIGICSLQCRYCYNT